MKSSMVLFLMIGFLIIRNNTQLIAQENYEIRKITFHGNHTLKDATLMEGMNLKSVSGLGKLFSQKEASLYNPDLMKAAMERLALTYQSEGFLNMKSFLHSPVVNQKNQTVRLTIDIKEGEPVVVDTVSIETVEKIDRINVDSLTKKVFRKIELKKKKRFRDLSLRMDVGLIEDAFKRHGYAYVEVNFDLKLRPKENLTSIYYSVNPGPICFFGETTVSGNHHIKEKYIRKEIKYKEGKIYNKSLLDQTRRNLYLLQVFRVASVLPETDAETQRNPIPVRVYVQEAPRLTTNFGVGYGTEDKFRTYVDLTYKGIFGSPRRLNLHLKHSALEPYTINLTWIQPQFLSANSTVAINPFLSRLRQPAINTRTYGVNVPFSFQFNDWLHASLTYYLEYVRQYVEMGDTTSRNFPYNKSGIMINGAFNNSYPRFSPKNGESLTAGVKFNGYLFGGDFSYTKLWTDFRIYRQLGNWIIAYRFMIGGINSADRPGFIPVEDRFYSGGSNSIRGWYLQQLGPKRSSGSPLGGKSIIENNLELRIPLFWKLSLVPFIDAGNIWIPSYSYHFNDLAYAAGGGLRIDTPIGPVRFDVGFPLWNKKTNSQFFLSVGQAF